MNTNIGDSVNRKFFTGFVICPFSTSHNPSRVYPEHNTLLESSISSAEKTRHIDPRWVVWIISASEVGPPLM